MIILSSYYKLVYISGFHAMYGLSSDDFTTAHHSIRSIIVD